MADIFKAEYAQFYDVFYRLKSYKNECLYLEALWKRFSKKKPRTVLDIGCGTGGHSNELAARGYRVTGIDGSVEMLQRAQEKARKLNAAVEYRRMRFQALRLKQKFDAAISMFSAIDYITEYNELIAFLKQVRKILKKGSLFIFDVWNGVAVSKYFMPKKTKAYHYKNFVITRTSHSFLHPVKSLLCVDHCVKVKNRETGMITFRRESHILRFFFAKELELLLSLCGFSVLSMHPFMREGREIRQNDWDITIVAKAQ